MKDAIITGASRGLGKETAIVFAEAGINVWLAARNTSSLHSVAEKFSSVTFDLFDCDLATKSGCEGFVRHIKENCGCPNIIINNLGMYEENTISKLSEEKLNKLLQVNFFSAFRITQAFLEDLKKKESAYIFNICSIVNKNPSADAAAYTMSKDLLRSYTKQLNLELKKYKVKVCSIIPAAINTSSWENAPEEQRNAMIQPKDIANTMLTAMQFGQGGHLSEIIIKN